MTTKYHTTVKTFTDHLAKICRHQKEYSDALWKYKSDPNAEHSTLDNLPIHSVCFIENKDVDDSFSVNYQYYASKLVLFGGIEHRLVCSVKKEDPTRVFITWVPVSIFSDGLCLRIETDSIYLRSQSSFLGTKKEYPHECVDIYMKYLTSHTSSRTSHGARVFTGEIAEEYEFITACKSLWERLNATHIQEKENEKS